MFYFSKCQLGLNGKFGHVFDMGLQTLNNFSQPYMVEVNIGFRSKETGLGTTTSSTSTRLDNKTKLDLAFNNVKPKDWFFFLDLVQFRTGCVILINQSGLLMSGLT